MFRKIVSTCLVMSLGIGVCLWMGNRLAAKTAEAKDSKNLGALVVDVRGPVTASALLVHDYQDALLTTLSNSLDRGGYTATLDNGFDLDQGSEAKLLRIQVLRWSIDRVGNAQCVFSATLSDGEGTQRLGIFHGTELGMLSGRSRFEKAQLMERAAEAAGSSLWSTLSKLSQ